MTNKIESIKSTTLMKTLSDEDIERNLKNGKFKIVSYEKNSVIHFDGYLGYDSHRIIGVV